MYLHGLCWLNASAEKKFFPAADLHNVLTFGRSNGLPESLIQKCHYSSDGSRLPTACFDYSINDSRLRGARPFCLLRYHILRNCLWSNRINSGISVQPIHPAFGSMRGGGYLNVIHPHKMRQADNICHYRYPMTIWYREKRRGTKMRTHDLSSSGSDTKCREEINWAWKTSKTLACY